MHHLKGDGSATRHHTDRQAICHGQGQTSTVGGFVVGIDQLKLEALEEDRHERGGLNGRKLLSQAGAGSGMESRELCRRSLVASQPALRLVFLGIRAPDGSVATGEVKYTVI